LAAATRALFLHQVGQDPTYQYLVQDEAFHDKVARAILAGEMPATSYYKAPLYIYVQAGLYYLLGADPMRVRWVQVFVVSLSPVLLALITLRLFGWQAAILAGITGALFWTFVFYATELVFVGLACLLYLLLAYLLVALPEGRSYKWLLCGLVLGLGAITRPNILAFAPVLAVIVVAVGWRRERRAGEATARGTTRTGPLAALRRPLLHSLALAAGCAMSVLPVTLHNRLRGGEWVLIATYGGLNSYVANGPYADGKHGSLIVTDGVPDVSARDPNNLWSRLCINHNIAQTYAQKQLGRPLSMAQVDPFFYRATLECVGHAPGRFLLLTFKRLCWFLNRHEFPSSVKDLNRLATQSTLLGGLSTFHFGVLCPLAVLGIGVLLVRRDAGPPIVYYAAMGLSLFLPGLFFAMSSRFRLPTVCLLVPFAAYGVVRFVAMWRTGGRWAARLAACAVLAAAAVFSNADLYGYATSNHTELRMTYAWACERTKRYDLLRDAAEQFERAYFDELDNHKGLPWAHVLNDAAPMTCLFTFYHRLGDPQKALRYGELMTQREPYNATAYMEYYRMLLTEGREEQARGLLDLFEKDLLPSEPEFAIECFIWHWEKFSDPSVLRRAEKLVAPLSKNNPDKTHFHFTLYKVRKLLEMTQPSTQPSTAPVTTPAK